MNYNSNVKFYAIVNLDLICLKFFFYFVDNNYKVFSLNKQERSEQLHHFRDFVCFYEVVNDFV